MTGTAYRLPDLSDLLDRNTATLAASLVVGDRFPRLPESAYFRHTVLLTEKAVRAYEAARHELLVYDEEAPTNTFLITPYMRAVFDLDTSLNALHRANENAARLCDLPTTTLKKADVLLRDNERAIISDVRNALEHTYGDIARGTLRGDLVLPSLDDRALEFGGHTIRYVDLARWLRKMSDFASKLVA